MAVIIDRRGATPRVFKAAENAFEAARQAGRAQAFADAAAASAVTAAADAEAAVEALALDAVAEAAAGTELALRDGHKIENLGALRQFFDKLDVFSQGEDGVITVACYGDSVSPECAIPFIDMLGRELVGFVGTSSWSNPLLNNAWSTPTGVEPSGRWPGSGGASYVLAGGASYVVRADGATPDPVYVPNSDQHWVIPNGGSVTWTLGLAGTNFRRALAFLVKEPGAGSATVELLNAATDAVIATDVVGSLANGSIDADHADFAALDTSLGYKIRITCTAGTIRALGVVGMKRRCVLPLLFYWGGSYLQQQNRSSTAIFNYICNVLQPAIWFVETRGETPAEFTGAGIGGDAADGIANLCTRLNAVSGSKVLIGGKPTTNATNDNAQTALYRSAARANDYVFLDGVALLKDNATLAAMNWNRKNNVVDNIHLPYIASGFVIGALWQQVPQAYLRNRFETRKVISPEVISPAFRSITPGTNADVTVAYTWARPANANTFSTQLLERIQSITLMNAVSGATGSFSMFGGDIRPDQNLNLASGKGYWINGVRLLQGQQSGWGVPTGTTSKATFATYTAGTTLTFGAAYAQAEHTATATRLAAVESALQDVSRRLAALITDLHQTNGGNLRLLSA